MSTFTPAKGRPPTLQYCAPAELRVDPSYQRSLESRMSQSLIKQIAAHWDWALCLPLIVSAREVDDHPVPLLYVIDGQHRLEAARMRGDIAHLPCVVTHFSQVEQEALSFVALNQNRRALSALDIFRASIASGDRDAVALDQAVRAAGLSFATHTNNKNWKPGQIACIGALRASWRKYGSDLTARALMIIGCAWDGQVMRYLGSIFPGLAAFMAHQKNIDFELLTEMMGGGSQDEWMADIRRIAATAEGAALTPAERATQAIATGWAEMMSELTDEDEREAA